MEFLISLLDNKEQREKTAQVVRVVRSNIRVKNYFGWRSFIDDVATDLVGYMIKTEFKYSAGAYVTCGMQSAIDHCRYCNAQKRRGDYEWTDIDECYDIGDNSYNPEKELVDKAHCNELYNRIAERFGQDLAEQLKPVIFDGKTKKLSNKILLKCKTEEFKQFLDEARNM